MKCLVLDLKMIFLKRSKFFNQLHYKKKAHKKRIKANIKCVKTFYSLFCSPFNITISQKIFYFIFCFVFAGNLNF